MGGRLAGKTALITAAGQGMGHAVAIAMAREGAQVLLHRHVDRLVQDLLRPNPA